MNVKVEAYLADKQRQEEAEKKAHRLAVLERAGLATRVYSQQEDTTPEFPLYDEKKYLSYRLVAEEVTDEEFARIEAYDVKAAEQKSGLFANIGEKLRSVAVFCFWLCVVGSCITGLVMMGSDSDMALIGLLVAVGGSLAGWFSSLVLYGFGELIVKTTEIANNTKKEA